MVKRAGKDVVPVEIYLEYYNLLKDKATSKRYATKEYINSLLAMNIERTNLLEKHLPHLSVYDTSDGKLTLADSKNKQLIDVYWKDCSLYCEYDKVNDCIHTRYVWAIPEVVVLLNNNKRSKKQENDDDGKDNSSSKTKKLVTVLSILGLGLTATASTIVDITSATIIPALTS
jgi:hypothetical protein